jgi:DNA-directed RNA polymerase subunit M/transcription elongation factor TFIIS
MKKCPNCDKAMYVSSKSASGRFVQYTCKACGYGTVDYKDRRIVVNVDDKGQEYDKKAY